MATSKKMTRAQKMEKNLSILHTIRGEIKDYSEIVAELKSDSAIQKSKKILARLEADEQYMLESTVRQGYSMIVEAKKVEAFVRLLPEILK
jgi:hypothetical protein